MILGRSVRKYQSFFCFNANNGIHGCTNRGYKSARIIDEAVLGTVMATLFTDDFLADLTADVNKRLACIARQLIPSTKKLEQEIANEDRQLRRLTDRLAKLDDTHVDAVLAKAEEMDRQLAAKREQLVRGEFANPDLPFVIVSLGQGGEKMRADARKVHDAQMAVAEKVERVTSVDTIPFYAPTDRSPFGREWDYHNNAETFLLIGEAMGIAMLKLLKKPYGLVISQVIPPASLARSGCTNHKLRKAVTALAKRKHRQAVRRRGRRAWGRRSRHRSLLRNDGKAPLARHLPDCVGETPGCDCGT
jgi:hypothetical protein